MYTTINEFMNVTNNSSITNIFCALVQFYEYYYEIDVTCEIINNELKFNVNDVEYIGIFKPATIYNSIIEIDKKQYTEYEFMKFIGFDVNQYQHILHIFPFFMEDKYDNIDKQTQLDLLKIICNFH